MIARAIERGVSDGAKTTGPARLEAPANPVAGAVLQGTLEPPTPQAQTARRGPGMLSGPIISFLLKTSFEKRRLVGALAMAGLLSGLINLAIPTFTMVVFDRVIPHGAFETLWALVLGVTLLLVIDLALRHVRHALGDAVSVSAASDLGTSFYQRLLQTPLDKSPRNAGILIQPWNDMNAAAMIAPQFVAGLLVDVPFFFIVIAFLASLGGWIAVVPVVGALMLFAVSGIAHALAVRDMRAENTQQQRQSQMLIDAVAARETIRTTGSSPQLLRSWEMRADEIAGSGHTLRSRQNLATHGGAVIVQFVTVATVAAGAYAVTASLMTVGALSACIMLASRALVPVSQLVSQWFRLRHILITTAVANAVLELDTEKGNDASGIGNTRPILGDFQLSNLTFGHIADAPPVISALNLKIAAGERVAIIGKSGCGKSTLLKLLTRLHEAAAGSIHLDGRDLKQIDPFELRRHVSLMPQSPVLFDATLEANVLAGLGPVSPEWIARVGDISGVNDFALKHPSGYSLPVGPGGQQLSGGERQSAALARTLMGKPALLLLDEPTAAMDNEREARIVKALALELSEGELKHSGLIIATHRMPILSLVTRIIWLDGGKVIADGPKDEIFRKFGLAA